MKTWITQLRSMAESPIKEEREAAVMLLIALGRIIRQFKRIREISKLLIDYQLTSPPYVCKWRFCLWKE